VRKVSWGLFLFVVVAGMASTIGGTAHAADKVRVGKAQAIAWTFVPLDIGIQEGIFARYGIDIEEFDLAGDAKVQQALAADSIDIGLGSGPGLAFIAKGSPAIGVAAFAGAPRNISLTVLADSPIKTVADMKGKLVSVSTVGSLSDWLTQQMSIAEGWGPKGIKTVALGAIDNSIAALRAHQLDAVILATEAGFRLEEAHRGRIIVSMDKFAPHFITHVVYARRQFLAEHPGDVDRFLKGFFASIRFLKTHRAITSKIAERVVHVSPAVADRIYDYEVSMLTDDGTFDPQAVKVLKQSFVEMGTLKTVPKDDALFTTRFLPVKP
jgi:ABC-type nitrate/sulfonate/bicarbonate transport system substrate-binding protein